MCGLPRFFSSPPPPPPPTHTQAIYGGDKSPNRRVFEAARKEAMPFRLKEARLKAKRRALPDLFFTPSDQFVETTVAGMELRWSCRQCGGSLECPSLLSTNVKHQRLDGLVVYSSDIFTVGRFTCGRFTFRWAYKVRTCNIKLFSARYLSRRAKSAK